MTVVSGLYAGSISDREVVEKSHFIDLLDHNDLTMADRGFEMQNMLAVKQVLMTLLNVSIFFYIFPFVLKPQSFLLSCMFLASTSPEGFSLLGSMTRPSGETP